MKGAERAVTTKLTGVDFDSTRVAVAVALSIGLFFFDLLTPIGSAEWLLYLFPVFLAAGVSPGSIFSLTALCSLLTVLGFVFSAHPIDSRIAALNRALSIGVFWGVAVILKRQKRAEGEVLRSRDELGIRVRERTAELAEANEALQKEMAERKKAEDTLRQAHKLEAIGTLAGGIAHDFNNILSVIVTNAEVALFDTDGDRAGRRNLEAVVKAGLRGRDLVRQILAFSRKSENEYKLFPLMPVLRDTFRMLRASIPTTIDMELRVEAESDMVFSDQSQMQQVVMNLCTNAAHAMREKMGTLRIVLRNAVFATADSAPDFDMAPGAYIVLSVSDTGCGMVDDVRRRVFEPFFTTKPAGEGTGLGLSVVYGIVKSHGGGVTVASEPGTGSVFSVYLPQAETVIPAHAETPDLPAEGNERILIVDDDPILAESVSEMLRRFGYEVTVISRSTEALTLFAEAPSVYDLVILDQTMPLMTGDKLAREMLTLRADLPVILCTGFSEAVSAETARAMGIQGFLMKPFTMREGAAVVRRLLDRKRAAPPRGTGFGD